MDSWPDAAQRKATCSQSKHAISIILCIIIFVVAAQQVVYVTLFLPDPQPEKPQSNKKIDSRPGADSPLHRRCMKDFDRRQQQNSSCSFTSLDVANISIHVFGWRRPRSLSLLLSQLKASFYACWKGDVNLHIHVDGNASAGVLKTVNSFSWNHGQLRRDIREENVGLREMWLSSLGAAAKETPDGLMIVFEDDMRISIFWFEWLLRMVWRYGRNAACRDPRLMGFSLSPIRLMELQKPPRRFQAWQSLQGVHQGDSVYLSTTPSSWGVAYWADRWLEFEQFARVRLQPAYYSLEAEAEAKHASSYDHLRMSPQELELPGGCRSNVWPHSWKRFMVDFMFGRGTVVLYPSLRAEKGMASPLQLQGKHTLTRKQGTNETLDDDTAGDSDARAPKAKDLKRNPRIAEILMQDEELLQMQLPDFADLQVFDLYLEPATLDQVRLVGQEFLDGIPSEYDNLVAAWRSSEVAGLSTGTTPEVQARNTPILDESEHLPVV